MSKILKFTTELGFKPETQSNTQREMVRAVAQLEAKGGKDSAAFEVLRHAMDKDTKELYALLGGTGN
ncbi:hypothetical protein [Azospirillum sp. B510]|uniref:hypothetical protein n=1 Tax=Azospirillum sp. (strain B510) TaxID=137722 RepID=UPI0011D06620|nr:hypothetical protein [Azospirillum sp. B510]